MIRLLKYIIFNVISFLKKLMYEFERDRLNSEIKKLRIENEEIEKHSDAMYDDFNSKYEQYRRQKSDERRLRMRPGIGQLRSNGEESEKDD